MTKEKIKSMHITVDWDLYCDSDEEGEQKEVDEEDYEKYEGISQNQE